MIKARAIIHLEDRARSEAAARWVSEAGFEAQIVESARGLGAACEGSPPAVIVVEGPLSGASAVEAVRWLRLGGVRCPAVFVCGSGIEGRALAQVQGVAPFAACGSFEAKALSRVVGAAGRASAPGPLPSSGSLEEIGLEELLAACCAAGFTGLLELERVGTTKTIYLDRGQPVYCSSSIFSENFGQMLLRKGLITEIEYNWARKIQQREGIRQGEALVKIGVLSHETLFLQLREQIREKMINAFAWADGQWSLQAGEEPLHRVTRFWFNPVELLVEGRCRFIVKEDVASAWGAMSGCFGVRSCAATTMSAAADEWLGVEAQGLMGAPVRLEVLADALGWDRERALGSFLALEALGYLLIAQEAAELPSVVATAAQSWPMWGEDDPLSVDEAVEEEDERETPSALSERLWRSYLRLTSADHFEALGVGEEAGVDEILVARDEQLEIYSAARFRPLLGEARLSHALKEIRTKLRVAAETLTDPARRSTYEEGSGRDQGQGDRDRFLSAEDAFVAGMSMLDAEPRSACRYFTRAAQLNPHEATYEMYQGWSMYRFAETAEQLEEARRHITRAISANPLLDEGYVFLGQIYLDGGDEQEACEQARTALAFNPFNDRAGALLSAASQGHQAPMMVSTSWL